VTHPSFRGEGFNFQTAETQDFIVIASQRVAPIRAPMTRSNSSNRKERKACFVASAPFRKRFAFVAGNDDEHRHDSTFPAARCARVVQNPSPKEGVGNAGRPVHPQPRV
jgi:hypothetical protein